MILTEVRNEGIKKLHSNGKRRQEIIIKNDKEEKFKIVIVSESYDFQSFARLSKWTDNDGWQVITSANPKKDYGIDIAYSSSYEPSAFKPIIEDFAQLIQEF